MLLVLTLLIVETLTADEVVEVFREELKDPFLFALAAGVGGPGLE